MINKRNIFLITFMLFFSFSFVSAETWKYNYLPEVEDSSGASNDTNSSEFWLTNIGALDGVNSTQFQYNAGNLEIKSSFTSGFVPFTGAGFNVDLGSHNLQTTGDLSASTGQISELYDDNGDISIHMTNRELFDIYGTSSINFQWRELEGTDGVSVIDWGTYYGEVLVLADLWFANGNGLSAEDEDLAIMWNSDPHFIIRTTNGNMDFNPEGNSADVNFYYNGGQSLDIEGTTGLTTLHSLTVTNPATFNDVAEFNEGMDVYKESYFDNITLDYGITLGGVYIDDWSQVNYSSGGGSGIWTNVSGVAEYYDEVKIKSSDVTDDILVLQAVSTSQVGNYLEMRTSGAIKTRFDNRGGLSLTQSGNNSRQAAVDYLNFGLDMNATTSSSTNGLRFQLGVTKGRDVGYATVSGIDGSITINANTGDIDVMSMISGTLTTNHGGTADVNYMYGTGVNMLQSSALNVNRIIGHNVWLYANDVGSVTSAWGFRVGGDLEDAPWTTVYGFEVQKFSSDLGGATSIYGLLVKGQDAGSTRNIGIHIEDMTGNGGKALVLDGDGEGGGLWLGLALDSSIYYDGTNLLINPEEIGSGYLGIVGSSRTGDGGTTNYLDISTDGTLTLVGTAKVDKHLSIQNANLGKGNTAPTQVILDNYNGWEFDINDDSILDIELPHELDTSEDIIIHISWYVDEAYSVSNAEVQWQLDWSATPHDSTEPIDAPTHGGTIQTGDINIPAMAKSIHHVTNMVIDAGNITDTHDLIGVKISRIALNGGSNPFAKPTVVGVHLEYTADKLGT